MQTNMRVNLGKNSYDIIISVGAIDRLGEHVKQAYSGRKIFVLTDAHVAPLYLERTEKVLQAAGYQTASLVLPAGESTKCLEKLAEVYNALHAFGATRSDALLALGGGVIGDLGGFAAATYMRGIPFMQVPTSLLAQVDSSVGGKVAVNLPVGKNLVGNFYQPKLVVIDPDTLRTLSDRQFREGMGEVIKYAAIRDAELFDLLEANTDREALMENIVEIIRRSLDIKRGMVENDERDTGERMLLNFGHTIGHSIEAAQNFSDYTHGEAVAAGMCLITELSENAGMTKPGTFVRLRALIEANNLPTNCSADLWPAMKSAVTVDKKHAGKKLTVVLVDKIGSSLLHATDNEFLTGTEALLR